ncbi:MAG: glycosyltransferase [Phycisphaerales bacterium]|nr:glycosyltransferase [Phycisphaerales bacterium]
MTLTQQLITAVSYLLFAGVLSSCGVLIFRVIIESRSVRPIRAGLAMPLNDDALRPVTIIVPAHNEERDISRCLTSLQALRYPKLRFIFALDRCTDRTEEIVRASAAEDHRITIITIDDCPDDWTGKVHAAYRGVTDSDALDDAGDEDWLLFTDADTIFHPDLIRAAVQYCVGRDLGFVSLLSTLTTDRWFERLVQPVACAQLLQIYPLRLANRHEGRRPLANGQFMLFRKDAYIACGTHEGVQKFLLEDLHFARRLNRAGVRMALAPAAGMLRCAMYDSYAAFRTGWKRIYIDCFNRRVRRMRKAVFRLRAVSFGFLATYAVTIAAIPLGDGLGAVIRLGILFAACLAAFGPLYRIQHVRIWTVLTFPVTTLMVAGILAEAADDLQQGKTITWGGRSYTLTAR